MSKANVISKLCESIVDLGVNGKPKAEIFRTKPYIHKSDPNRKNIWFSDTIMLSKTDEESKRALFQLENKIREFFERKKLSPLYNVTLDVVDYTEDLSFVIDKIYDKYLDWHLVQ